MIAWALEAQPDAGPIRPFQPHRDLAALADLIEIAFGEDLVLTGSRMVRDLRQMALAGPLLQLARPALDFLSGFVWCEGNAFVGNISLNHKGRGVWTLTNVAVLPERRGRGIAGQLVDTAIAHARQQGARLILLQVRADNAHAQQLYRRRGFVRFDTWHELNLAKQAQHSVIGPLADTLRQVRMGDGRALYRLALASTPAATQRCLPPAADDLRRDWRWAAARWLRSAFAGADTLELVGPCQGNVVAHARLKTSLGAEPFELVLRVTPAERGRWELPLLEGLLVLARDLPRQDWRSYVSDTHPEALGAFGQLGAKTLRVLDQMVLELD